MATNKDDIRQGTWLRKALADGRAHSAVRAGAVTGLSGGRGDLNEGIEAVIAALGPAHADIPTLPLRVVEAVHRGDAAIRYRAFYHTGATYPNEDPWLAVDVDVTTYALTWWRDGSAWQTRGDGAYPNGPINEEFNPYLGRDFHKAWTWRVPIWIITCRFATDTPIIADVAGLAGHINGDDFDLGGHTFPGYALLFQAPKQRSIFVGSGVDIRVQYQWLYRPDGWYRQKYHGDSVTQELMAPQADFDGAFPP